MAFFQKKKKKKVFWQKAMAAKNYHVLVCGLLSQEHVMCQCIHVKMVSRLCIFPDRWASLRCHTAHPSVFKQLVFNSKMHEGVFNLFVH